MYSTGILVKFEWNLNFLDICSKNIQMSNLINPYPTNVENRVSS